MVFHDLEINLPMICSPQLTPHAVVNLLVLYILWVWPQSSYSAAQWKKHLQLLIGLQSFLLFHSTYNSR